MNARGLFDFLQKVTDLGMSDIARAIDVPEVMLRNILRHAAPWGLVSGPEVVSRLALAAKAVSVDQGPDGVSPWLHLHTLTEAEVLDPFSGGIDLCGKSWTLAEEIDLAVEEVWACRGRTLRDILDDNPEAMQKYADWLCRYGAALEADELLPMMAWADWAAWPGVAPGVAPAARC